MRLDLFQMSYIFLCGFGGSLALDIVSLAQHAQSEPYTIPARFKRVSFWLIRLLLAIVAGGMALAYEIDKPLLAINIGVATPLILKAFAEGIKPVAAELPKATAEERQKQ